DPALDLAGAGPAAGPRVFTGRDRPGAGRAPDGRVAQLAERVHQDVVLGDVGVDLLVGPPGQRADLDLLPLGVPAHDGGVGPGGRLGPAHPAGPRVVRA